MQREARAYLWDIAAAAASIRAFTEGKDLDVYLVDEIHRAAANANSASLARHFRNCCAISPNTVPGSRWLLM